MTVPALTGIPSRCFMIRNMFDPAEENEENWDQEIREDVMEECGKYGTVVHCHVENRKPGGLVFLKFAALEPAVQAAISLNGRFFAGKKQKKKLFVVYILCCHFSFVSLFLCCFVVFIF